MEAIVVTPRLWNFDSILVWCGEKSHYYGEYVCALLSSCLYSRRGEETIPKPCIEMWHYLEEKQKTPYYIWPPLWNYLYMIYPLEADSPNHFLLYFGDDRICKWPSCVCEPIYIGKIISVMETALSLLMCVPPTCNYHVSGERGLLCV